MTTVAWLFPGQGSQAVGMAKDLLAASPGARAVMARADAALGEPLSQLIAEGPEAELTLTANAQPALLATSIAILAAIRERWPDLPLPAYAAGHSLGEYSALTAVSALELEAAIRLVRVRGRAMQGSVPPGAGAMAAVMGMSAPSLEELCREVSGGDESVTCANFNAPGQIVIAGHTEAVKRASALASEKGRVIPLKVSAPFHSPLMSVAASMIGRELETVTIGPLAVPVVSNVNALPYQQPAEAKELLVAQIDGAVRWEETMRFLHAQGVTHALEIGPGKVLTGLAKRTIKEMRVLPVNDPASVEEVGPFLGLGPAASTPRPENPAASSDAR